MKLDFSSERVLAVVAHPDDAELLCAGTLARARCDGAAVGICVLCLGDKGQPSESIEDLAEVRRVEATEAARLLGAEISFVGLPDGNAVDDAATRQQLLEHVRAFAPTLMIGHARNDYHADHRAASALAESVSWFAASNGHESTSPVLPQPPSLWWMDTVTGVGFEPAFFVDISEHVETKRQMIHCHHSQLQRAGDSDFSPLEQLMLDQCRLRGHQSGVAAAEAFQQHRAWKRGRAW